ncbi:hypothetical protein C8Q72DRAFT_827620 [Fomitopsis betulina]|nr:hypothetical protein C8Q72DRAFT_827620 [Fomitopsis betulina]
MIMFNTTCNRLLTGRRRWNCAHTDMHLSINLCNRRGTSRNDPRHVIAACGFDDYYESRYRFRSVLQFNLHMAIEASLDNLLGAMFIGVVLSTAVYGITCLQVYLYYMQYSRDDSRAMKLFVAFLLVLDTFHVALLAMVYYHYSVTHFGDSHELNIDTWSLSAQNTVGGFMSFLVQCFFAHRLYQLSGKQLWLPIIICIISLGQLATAAAYTGVGISIKYLSASQKSTPFVTASLLLDVVCDSLIASSMIYFFRRKRTMFRSTRMALDLMITYALNTCLLTTVFTVVTLVLWYVATDTLIYSPFYWVLVRLYSCSLVSTLNTRENVKNVLTSDTHELYNMPSITAVPTDLENGSVGRIAEGKGWSVHRSVTVDISTDYTTASGRTTLADDTGSKDASLTYHSLEKPKELTMEL